MLPELPFEERDIEEDIELTDIEAARLDSLQALALRLRACSLAAATDVDRNNRSEAIEKFGGRGPPGSPFKCDTLEPDVTGLLALICVWRFDRMLSHMLGTAKALGLVGIAPGRNVGLRPPAEGR